MSLSAVNIPEGFVDLQDLMPDLVVALAYYSDDNFVGERIDGYEANRALLSRPAAEAVQKVQAALAAFGLGLKILDAYRPQQAVDHFLRWARQDGHEQGRERFYPGLDKATLFREGYVATHSSHTRGSTVDLTIIDLATGQELDMGSEFDFFSTVSWPEYLDLTPNQRANRLLLQNLMLEQGFLPFAQEWWHFTLANEPWPDTWFDFPIR
ncbi:M15 family metallopeptidase [Parathalassolituus penaei]|uniref:D-alanyl-D-alanine dipeptidase n=1 Tax=Parathalassolituus penaei TaxID=2997323 RepID=A0A9X3EH03_9GAMM|nr:M15 family metallopeptidase [Parathalassolituus penaei]MCY0967035.1 M15 family metallopeptidase [Parathalassolituus penaei]